MIFALFLYSVLFYCLVVVWTKDFASPSFLKQLLGLVNLCFIIFHYNIFLRKRSPFPLLPKRFFGCHLACLNVLQNKQTEDYYYYPIPAYAGHVIDDRWTFIRVFELRSQIGKHKCASAVRLCGGFLQVGW